MSSASSRLSFTLLSFGGLANELAQVAPATTQKYQRSSALTCSCPCIGRAWNPACCPSTNARALLETCHENTMVLHTLSFRIASGDASEGALKLRPARECLMPAWSDASCSGRPCKSAPEARYVLEAHWRVPLSIFEQIRYAQLSKASACIAKPSIFHQTTVFSLRARRKILPEGQLRKNKFHDLQILAR